MKPYLFFLFLICFLLTQCGKHTESNCVPKGLILSNPKFTNSNDTTFHDYRLQELLQDPYWTIVFDVKNATCDSISIHSNKFKHALPDRIDFYEKNGENSGALINTSIGSDKIRRIGLAPGEMVKMSFNLNGDTAISRFDSIAFYLSGSVKGYDTLLVAKWENTD